MRNKRYFWNRKHHRELDRKMGLSKPMNEPFGALARACGMSDELAGTHAMDPFFIFKVKPQDIKRTQAYDVTDKGTKHTFLIATFLMSQN